MRLGKPSLETYSHALFPRAPLTATLLICCRLRGVSMEEEVNHKHERLGSVQQEQRGAHIRQLTLIELEAEVRGGSHAGVVDRFFV